MTQADGSILIDSQISEKGFNQGVGRMTSLFKKFASSVIIGLGVRAFARFGKSAVDEAAKMASAIVGLQSVVEGTGRSFKVAQDFIDAYTKDGLVPAGNAISAYKNLLLRGYNTEQVEKVLTIFKDTAAFARQGQLTIGEAVEGATQGVKNQISNLIDNAGVTKNLSNIHKDYAASIGTTIGMLTEEQKILAEVNGFMEESRFQTGDAAKLSQTYAGKVSAMSVSFLNLKVALGNVFIPILAQIIPIIRVAIDALTVFFNKLAQIVNILFGTNIGTASAQMAEGLGGVADNSKDAAGGMGDLADNTKKAGKEARGALAGFDKLNVLSKPTSTSAGAGGGAGAGGAGVGAGLDLPNPADSEFAQGLDELSNKVLAWKDKFFAFFEPVTDALGRLKVSLEPLGQTIWEGLQWAWENVLVPFGSWSITDLIPAFLDAVGAAAGFLNAELVTLRPAWDWFWINVLEPLATWTGGAIVETWESITWALDMWTASLEEANPVFDAILITLAVLAAILLAVGAPIWLVVAAILAIVVAIKNWGEVTDWWHNVVVKKFREGADAIQSAIFSAFDGIKSFAKNVLNTVIGYVNGMIFAIVSGINSVIFTLNSIKVSIPAFIPIYGGQTFGLNVPYVSAPQIPKLAQGAVIPPNAQFAAILGDQKSGKNIESPVETMRQVFAQELAKAQGSGGSENFTVEAKGQLGPLIRLLNLEIKKDNNRQGGSLISGVTS